MSELEEIIESLEYSLERAREIHLTRQQYKRTLKCLKWCLELELEQEEEQKILKKEYKGNNE